MEKGKLFSNVINMMLEALLFVLTVKFILGIALDAVYLPKMLFVDIIFIFNALFILRGVFKFIKDNGSLEIEITQNTLLAIPFIIFICIILVTPNDEYLSIKDDMISTYCEYQDESVDNPQTADILNGTIMSMDNTSRYYLLHNYAKDAIEFKYSKLLDNCKENEIESIKEQQRDDEIFLQSYKTAINKLSIKYMFQVYFVSLVYFGITSLFEPKVLLRKVYGIPPEEKKL